MKKGNYWVLTIISIIVIILFAIWFFGNRKSNIEPTAEPSLELVADNNEASTSSTVLNEDCDTYKIVGLSISGEELIRLYETIARLEAELAACEDDRDQGEKVKKPTEPRQSGGRTAKTTEKPVKEKSSDTGNQQSETASSSSITGEELAISKYKGKKDSDICITFDENSFLIYCMKKTVIDGGDGNSKIDGLISKSLNVNNQYREIYEEDEYYVARSNVKVDINMLLNKASFNFAWHVGTHANGYSIWLPHEAYKEMINPYYPDNFNSPELVKKLAPYNIRPNQNKGYEYYGLTINYKSK